MANDAPEGAQRRTAKRRVAFCWPRKTGCGPGARPRRVAPKLVIRPEVLIHQHPTVEYRRLWALLRFRQGQRITLKTV